MPDHTGLHDALAFIQRHGYVLLFVWVLTEQCAIPAPSVPLLLAAGALTRNGGLHLLPAILCCSVACLVGDTVWFMLGRHSGRKVLRLLCRISLEPDSCVRQTENTFRRNGMKSLLVSKFIPGLNTVAAPLVGNSRVSYAHFALFDIAGAVIWSSSYLVLGYVFSDQLEKILGYSSRMGSNLLLLIVVLFGAWIAFKFVQRRRFLRKLKVARITAAELNDRMNTGEQLFIVDLRAGLDETPDLIPGAMRISSDDLIARAQEIPRDRDIILFCS